MLRSLSFCFLGIQIQGKHFVYLAVINNIKYATDEKWPNPRLFRWQR